MNKINYQRKLDVIIDGIVKEGTAPSLLLHACCAPCSSYCLIYLAKYFNITAFYYNPNITSSSEYYKRMDELKRLIGELRTEHEISFMQGKYEPEKFIEISKGLEDEPEGGSRCRLCYELRQREAARVAAGRGFDYFTTTLSISPLKDAQALNEIGLKLQDEYNVKYLLSDFKKKGGYQKSIEYSKKYSLYRQNYCGCIFSMKNAAKKEPDGRAAKVEW